MARFIGMLVLVAVLIGLGRTITSMSPSAAEASIGAVEPLVEETLSPQGLGDLRLTSTTLVDVIERFGLGRASLLLSDDVAVELVFADGALCLMFCAPHGGAAHRRAMRDGPRGPSMAIHSGAAVLMDQYPEFASLPLTSISVRRPWFRGRTSTGVRLGDDFAEVLRRHPETGELTSDPFVAGTATPEPLGRPHRSAGLLFFPEYDPAPRAPTSGPFDSRLLAPRQELEMIVAYRRNG